MPQRNITALIDRLRAFYGALPSPPSNPFALYVWEVLSVDTSPVRRDAAFNALRRIPSLTPDAMAKVPQAKLEAAVAHAGAKREERVRAIRAGVEFFRRNPTAVSAFGGRLMTAMRAAIKLPHLGRASVLRMLLFAGGHPVLPLDEHSLRVAQRLGFGDPRGPGGTRRVLRTTRASLRAATGDDVEMARAVAQYFTHHGIATCTEAAPHCAVCPLAPDCEWLRLQ